MVYAFWHVEESTWVTLNLADVQKRRDKLKVGPTHEKVWAALRWHENSQEERSWHMGRQETRWKEFRCEVWRVQCDVWGHVLDSNTATASHKARTHGPGWEELRWEEMSWDEVRRAQMRWRVQCEVWGKKSAVWSVKCGVWSVKCEVWSVKCEVWSAKSAVSSVKCEVELQMWHVEQDTTFAECTHAQAWLAHGACKFYRWERSHIYF